MKTQNQFRIQGKRIFLLTLPVIFIIVFSVSSCENKKTGSDESLVYTEVDIMPVFSGGDQEIINFISRNTNYPEEAKKNNITGKVIVRFIVEKDGTVAGAEVIKSADPLLDAEALRVVGSLPRFEKPAKKDGKIVRVHYMVPISFALQ